VVAVRGKLPEGRQLLQLRNWLATHKQQLWVTAYGNGQHNASRLGTACLPPGVKNERSQQATQQMPDAAAGTILVMTHQAGQTVMGACRGGEGGVTP
jgi:hypothetical protein